MPTTRRRHQITETSEVERAIELALLRWPGETRSRALLRLVDLGAGVVEADLDQSNRNRARAVDDLANRYGGLVSNAGLAELRRDWPA